MNKKGYLNKLILACLALLMSFSVSLKAYAADAVTIDSVRAAWLAGDSSINLSDYYFIYNTTRTQWGSTFDCVFYMFLDSGYKGDLFLYIDEDSSPVSGNYIGMSYCDGEYLTAKEAGVYCRNAWYDSANGTQYGSSSGYGFGLNMQYFQPGNMDTDFRFGSTNIPLFSSLDAAKAFYSSGDTSGLLNPDNVPKAYSKDIETPKNLRVDMDADFRAQMGYAPGNGDEDVDASNSYCKFTWSQSDEVVEAGNYVTEIYYQTSFVHHSNPLCIGNKTFSLSSSKLVAAVPVDKVNMSYTMDFSRIEEIYQEWLDAGLIGGTMKPTYPTEPYYFYLRNVVGNTYGNWVRVTVNNDNVSVSNSITGANTVTGGYMEIDGSTATLPDINQKLDGDVVNDSQYGINYRVDIDKESYNDIITFIKNGFGLLGEDGLIAFFKSVFSFLPEPVWAMIFCMVGTCVVFIVVKVAIG